MKTFTIKNILMLCLVMLGLSAQAVAAPTVPVNSLRITGLSKYNGQYLTAYYAVGRKASIATEPNQIQITEVKAKNTVRISSEAVDLPKANVALMGMSTYNLIVFVVHAQNPFRWINVNGEVPVNEIQNGTNVYSAMQSASKNELDQVKNQLGIENSDTTVPLQLF